MIETSRRSLFTLLAGVGAAIAGSRVEAKTPELDSDVIDFADDYTNILDHKNILGTLPRGMFVTNNFGVPTMVADGKGGLHPVKIENGRIISPL